MKLYYFLIFSNVYAERKLLLIHSIFIVSHQSFPLGSIGGEFSLQLVKLIEGVAGEGHTEVLLNISLLLLIVTRLLKKGRRSGGHDVPPQLGDFAAQSCNVFTLALKSQTSEIISKLIYLLQYRTLYIELDSQVIEVMVRLQVFKTIAFRYC